MKGFSSSVLWCVEHNQPAVSGEVFCAVGHRVSYGSPDRAPLTCDIREATVTVRGRELSLADLDRLDQHGTSR